MKAKLLLIASGTSAAWSALWTFPSMLASAFLVAWGAEAAQFLISQGLALAILAWLQTLPEFAVEAVIAWEAAARTAVLRLDAALRMSFASGDRELHRRDPPAGRTRLADDLLRRRRLRRVRARPFFSPIVLDDEHSVEVLTTVPPLVYFVWIWYKASIDHHRRGGADRHVRRVSRDPLADAAARARRSWRTHRASRAGRTARPGRRRRGRDGRALRDRRRAHLLHGASLSRLDARHRERRSA